MEVFTMSTVRKLVLGLVLALSIPAWAETVPPGAVSEINGQLVKVGEHNEYKVAFRRWNVATNPIGLIIGSYAISVSYGFHENVAVRIDASYMDLIGNDDNRTTSEIGIGVPLYLRRTYSGLFVEPGLIHRTTRVGGTDESDTVAGPQVLLGWHWAWDSGFNAAMAFGLGRDVTGDDSDEPFVNGYLRIGYSF